MNHKILISLTACFVLSLVPGLSVASVAGNESETNTEAEQYYKKAYELRRATDYDSAIAEYEKVKSLSPNSKIAQNAQYWMGQSYFKARQLDAALSAFQELLDKYPASPIIPSTKQMIEHVQQAKKNRALFEAVKKADVEQVKLLIAEGADVNIAEDDTLVTPLLAAADEGHADVVRVLLENGAKVDAADSRGVRAIHHAIWNDHEEILSTLISHGADLNGQDKSGYAMLHSAAAYGYMEAATLLISKGADINITDNVGRTPIELAMKGNHTKIVELLSSKGASIPPLHLALFYKDEAKARDLIEARANVNEKTSYGSTPLYWACQACLAEIVKLLIEKGADVNIQGDLRQNEGESIHTYHGG